MRLLQKQGGAVGWIRSKPLRKQIREVEGVEVDPPFLAMPTLLGDRPSTEAFSAPPLG